MTMTDIHEDHPIWVTLAQQAQTLNFLVSRHFAQTAVISALVAHVTGGDPAIVERLRSSVRTALAASGAPLDEAQLSVIASLSDALDDALSDASTHSAAAH